jgi:uncharacterized membrane protein
MVITATYLIAIIARMAGTLYLPRLFVYHNVITSGQAFFGSPGPKPVPCR